MANSPNIAKQCYVVQKCIDEFVWYLCFVPQYSHVFLQFFQEGLNVIEVHDDQKNKVLTVYNNGEVMPCNFSEKVRPCVNPTPDLIVQAGLENGTYVVHLMTPGIKQFAGGVCFDHYAVHVICNIIIHIYIVLKIPKL